MGQRQTVQNSSDCSRSYKRVTRLIVERTQEGKALAKQRDDFREGRPRKHSKQQVEHTLKLLETHTYKEVKTMTGITKRTPIRRKNEQEAKVKD